MSRNTVRLRRLIAMDTDATENASEVERIKREASLLGRSSSRGRSSSCSW